MLGFASSVPGAVRDREVHLDLVSSQPPTDSHPSGPPGLDLPFMSTMDEITYWIYTKRAPCLLQYDIVAKKQQLGAAQCSKTEQKIPSSVLDNVTSPKKKKKRKLTILEDNSVSEKVQNVYFDVSKQQNDKELLSSGKSETIGSNEDDNIKKSSMRNKRKRLKLQKNSRAAVNKNNKIVTSTPRETTRLRRNLRKSPKDLNDSSQYNSSFKVNNCTINGKNPSTPKKAEKKAIDESKNNSEKAPENRLSKLSLNTCEKVNNGAKCNGQFEDLSDVSGFTANYIRSTKVQVTKSTRKLRSKGNHSFVKGIKMGDEVDNAMVVCVNKPTNPGLSKTALNCSSDSSQRIIDVVTVEDTDNDTRVHKNTSAMKFINKSSKSKEGVKFKTDNDKKPSVVTPVQTCTTSRYPKRTKNVSEQVLNNSTVNLSLKKKSNKNNNVNNNSERKENPEETFTSKTRSGRSLGLSLCVPENSVLVISNSTEPVSSSVSMNVARPGTESPTKKRVSPRKCTRSKRNVDKSTRRTSVRDKSGFSACFSDSDDDKPLKLQKFFE